MNRWHTGYVYLVSIGVEVTVYYLYVLVLRRYCHYLEPDVVGCDVERIVHNLPVNLRRSVC